MSMVLLIIVSCLPTIRADYQELKLISELNDYYKFDHNIFLFDSTVDFSRFIGPKSITPQTVHVFKNIDSGEVSGMSISETWKDTGPTSKNIFVIVVLGGIEFERNLYLLNEMNTLYRQIDIKVGIFFPYIVTDDDVLKSLHDWLMQESIVYFFAAIPTEVVEGSNRKKSLNVFTSNNGSFDVVSGTDGEIPHNGSFEKNIFLVSSKFPLYSFVFEERLVGLWQTKSSSDEKFWAAVLRDMNVSTMNNPTQIYFNQDPFDCGDPSYVRGGDLYPIYFIKNVHLVPESLPYPGLAAYFKAMTTYSILGYTLLAIVVIIIFLIYVRYKRQKKFLLYESVTDVLKLLMNDNGFVKYQQLSGIEVVIILPLTFSGLIIVNGILSALQSYLTRPILQPQIETFEDIKNSDSFYLHFDTYVVIKGEFSVEGGYADVSQLNDQIETFNRSIASGQFDQYAEMLVRVQKRLNIKGYYITTLDSNGSPLLFCYSINSPCPFIEHFNGMVHRLFSSGLYQHWNEEHWYSKEQSILKKNREILENRGEEHIDSFEMPMFLYCGWIVSTIVFAIEIIWNKLKVLRMVERFQKFRRLQWLRRLFARFRQ